MLLGIIFLKQVNTASAVSSHHNGLIHYDQNQICIGHCSAAESYTEYDNIVEECIDKCGQIQNYFEKYQPMKIGRLLFAQNSLRNKEEIENFRDFISKILQRLEYYNQLTKLSTNLDFTYKNSIKLDYHTDLYFCYNDCEADLSQCSAFNLFIEEISNSKNSNEFFSAYSDLIISEIVYYIYLSSDLKFEINDEIFSIIGFFDGLKVTDSHLKDNESTEYFINGFEAFNKILVDYYESIIMYVSNLDFRKSTTVPLFLGKNMLLYGSKLIHAHSSFLLNFPEKDRFLASEFYSKHFVPIYSQKEAPGLEADLIPDLSNTDFDTITIKKINDLRKYIRCNGINGNCGLPVSTNMILFSSDDDFINIIYTIGGKFFLLQLISTDPESDKNNDLLYRCFVNGDDKMLRIFYDPDSELMENGQTNYWTLTEIETVTDDYFYYHVKTYNEASIKSFLKFCLNRMKAGYGSGHFHMKFSIFKLSDIKDRKKHPLYGLVDYSEVKYIQNPTSSDYKADLNYLYDKIVTIVESENISYNLEKLDEFLEFFLSLDENELSKEYVDLLLNHSFLTG